jgi:hypothetical protein
LQAEVQLGRLWRFEAVHMVVLFEHETRMGEMLRKLEDLKASPDAVK